MEQNIEIIELKAGNVKVYEALFKRLYEPLCQYAYNFLYDHDEAEDTVQKIFCKLWELREKTDIHTSTKSYLYKMVHNACLNRIKQIQKQSEHHDHIASQSVLIGNNIEYEMIHKELHKQIDLAVAALPERCRQVFLLSRIQHLSYMEIAQEMQISHNTVETQIVKALKSLRLQLKDFLMVALFFFLHI